ncbi:phosphatase PAP2 family protein [Natrarchaeobius sp. A-rgal3]|uniref:phosphatase PAP2 family protein n=1 Tax=Natrarchaeobius versutus TaxID=1679078 RepID=UPI00350EF3B6
MSRGIGEFDLLQGHVPEWLAVAFALLTQLGDAWFLALLLGTLYWHDRPRREGIAAVTGLWLAGMGLYKGLKELFGWPRPDQPLLEAALFPWPVEPVYEATAFAAGYGFPSGHAVNTTVVYVGLATVLAVGTRRGRLAVAGAIVATVSFTRVALGVHYLVDVVAGAALGAALLLVATALFDRTPVDRVTTAFGLASGFALFFILTGGPLSHGVALLVASVGLLVGWRSSVLPR